MNVNVNMYTHRELLSWNLSIVIITSSILSKKRTRKAIMTGFCPLAVLKGEPGSHTSQNWRYCSRQGFQKLRVASGLYGNTAAFFVNHAILSVYLKCCSEQEASCSSQSLQWVWSPGYSEPETEMRVEGAGLSEQINLDSIFSNPKQRTHFLLEAHTVLYKRSKYTHSPW